MTFVPEEQPLELIDRLIAGVVHLIVCAHDLPQRARLERSWWALSSLKHGAKAALSDTSGAQRELSSAGRNMLIAYCDSERSGVYRAAAQLGLVPRAGGTWMEPGVTRPPDPSQTSGSGLDNLMGL